MTTSELAAQEAINPAADAELQAVLGYDPADEEAVEPEEDAGGQPSEYHITAYGVDFPVDAIVKRMDRGDIFIPDFQRAFVWPQGKASRFVESLLMGLPVPGVFLAKEPDTQKLLVIDGQQRLRTLQFFHGGVFANTGREFKLTELESRFDGLTYKLLPPDDQRRLDDYGIHATIIQQDKPADDTTK